MHKTVAFGILEACKNPLFKIIDCAKLAEEKKENIEKLPYKQIDHATLEKETKEKIEKEFPYKQTVDKDTHTISMNAMAYTLPK